MREPFGQALSDFIWLALIGSQRSFFGHVLPLNRNSFGSVMFSAAELAGCPVPEPVDWVISMDRFAGRGFSLVPAFFDFGVVLKSTFIRVSSWSASAMPGIASRSAPASRLPMIFRVMYCLRVSWKRADFRRPSRRGTVRSARVALLNSSSCRADAKGVSVNDLVLVQGMRDTKLALARWNGAPATVLRPWLRLSALISVGLLFAVY